MMLHSKIRLVSVALWFTDKLCVRWTATQNIACIQSVACHFLLSRAVICAPVWVKAAIYVEVAHQAVQQVHRALQVIIFCLLWLLWCSRSSRNAAKLFRHCHVCCTGFIYCLAKHLHTGRPNRFHLTGNGLIDSKLKQQKKLLRLNHSSRIDLYKYTTGGN